MCGCDSSVPGRITAVYLWSNEGSRLFSHSKDMFEGGRVHRIELEDFLSGVISIPLTVGSGGPQGKLVLEYVIFAGSVGALYLNCEELVSKEAC